MRGGSGAQVLSVSQLQLAFGGKRGPHISGNLVTGGADLPHLTGRIERQPGGQVLARFAMPEYRAGDAALALDGLSLVLSPQGTLGFSGRARASGALPGGRADQLDLPVEGNWSAARGLSALRKCTPFTFRSLSLYNVTLDSRSVTLCPGPEGAILRSDSRGTRFAAGAPSLKASGRLGSTPIRLTSGPIGFAVPGALAAKQLDVSLGPVAAANQFTLSNLTAKIGNDVTGHFTGTDVKLAAVPLDILDADGDWRLADGKLTISNGLFRLQDREEQDRFRPMNARDATLSLVDNQVVADAVLREPASDREVASDFQLIAGTNRDLAQQVAQGAFREDLLARIHLWTFHLPGLAQRLEDLEPNLDYELDRVPQTLGTRVTFSAEARAHFLAFATSPDARWTGNFRDLNAAVTRMATLAPGGRIDVPTVDEELSRLRQAWQPVSTEPSAATDRDLVTAVLGADRAALLDRFDCVQLADVLRVCRAADSLSAAGRILFAESQARKQSGNDADRLRKYLARHGLQFAHIRHIPAPR